MHHGTVAIHRGLNSSQVFSGYAETMDVCLCPHQTHDRSAKKNLKKKNNINQLWALSKWASCKHHHTEQSIWVCAAISRAAQNWKWNSNDWRGSNRSSCVACVLYLVGLRVDLRDGSEHYGRLLASASEHTVYGIWYAISRWAFIVFFFYFFLSLTHTFARASPLKISLSVWMQTTADGRMSYWFL